MLVDPRTVELTRGFYDWELRGRGWTTYPYAVVLEPPFRPFLGHWLPRGHRLDDARRHTWLSSLVESFRAAAPAPEAQEDLPEDDPKSFAWRSALREFTFGLREDEPVPRPAALSLLQSLATASAPLVFEVVGSGGQVEIRLTCAEEDAALVLGAVGSFFPAAVVEEALPLRHLWDATAPAVVALEFGLAREFMVPLRIPAFAPDPLTAVVGGVAGAGEGELAVAQLVFEGVREPWAESIVRAVTAPDGKPFFADAPEVTAFAREKVSADLFAAVLRVATCAESHDRAWEALRAIAGGFALFGSPDRNELAPLGVDDHALLVEDILNRTTHRSGMILSAEELVGLVHPPTPSLRVPGLWRGEVEKAPPAGLLSVSGVALGESVAGTVRLPDQVRLRHVHVVGASGTGKSTLLARMILEDIERGAGVGLLDPHGDLVDEILGRIPEHRMDDVIVFDPSEEQPVGWNILGAESEVEKDLLASDLVGVFRRLSTSWGDQMTAVLGNAVIVFLESPRGGTLLDLRRFLVDAAFRKELLATVRDEYTVSFWETEFPLLIGKRPQAPILTRLDGFLRSRLVRRVVTATDRPLDFRAVVDQGKIFLAKLAQGLIGQENAAFLGSLLVAKFHQVTLARQEESASARRPFFLFLDEFHEVATPSMASLFSGARKFALGVTVAHQDLHQLKTATEEVQRAVLANAHTRVVFHVGEEDARVLERGFADFTAEDLTNLSIGAAICRVGRAQDDFRLVTARLPEIETEKANQTHEQVRALSRERHGTSRRDDGSPPLGAQDAKGASAPSSPTEPATSSQDLPEILVEPISPPGPGAGPGASPAPGLQAAHASAAEPAQGEPRHNQKRGRPALPGRGGPEHTYLQSLITEWGQARGFKVEMEKEVDGGRVDVALTREGRSIACEISVSTSVQHEVENVRKCLAGGFETVFVVALRQRFLTELGRILDEQLPASDRSRVNLVAPQELAALLAAEPIEAGTVAGYRVRTRSASAESADSDRRRRALAEVVARSLRRLRRDG